MRLVTAKAATLLVIVVSCSLNGNCGTPGRIRTCGLLLRRQTLYPSELQAHSNRVYPQGGAAVKLSDRMLAVQSTATEVHDRGIVRTLKPSTLEPAAEY